MSEKLIHKLIGEDDPQGWLVAADLLEEAGADENAARWRFRGEHWKAMYGAFIAALFDKPQRQKSKIMVRTAQVGRFHVFLVRRPKTVKVDVLEILTDPIMSNTRHFPGCGLWLAVPGGNNLAKKRRYHRQKLFLLLDSCQAALSGP